MTSSSQKFQDHGGLHPSRGKLHVTVLASEWRSTKGGLSTISRELAIELAKFPEVKITYFVPQCSDEDKRTALSHHIEIVEATRLSGYDELEWLSFPPDDLQIDVIVGHGVKLGRQAQVIRKSHKCKWIQVVHTDPEELGMYKSYENPISTGEKKHKVEVELCEKADFVVGVGPKLCEAFRRYLRWCNKDKTILDLTPGVFDEFVNVEHAFEERERCGILVFGRGDAEDFQLKGFDVAGKAVAELSDAHLVFVGAPEGRQEDTAKRLLECGLPAHRLTVRSFLQSREDLKRLFCQVDLVLMPSRTEGFGLTGLEALSAGLPVLVSKNSGFGEALCKVPFGSACVIDSEDPLVWAEAIKEVWKKDRETRLQEAELLRSSYKKKYSWAKQSEDLVKKMVNIVNHDCQSSSQGEEGLSVSSTTQAPQTMTGEQKAMSIIDGLQRMHCDPSKFQKKTGLPKDLQTIASDKGFSICDNPGSGNCMFYALSEQLQSVKGIQISDTELRKKLVEHLGNSPKLTDGTDLFDFVHGYPSWADYLRNMEKDGTWGDHLILRAAANCYKTPIRVISSLDRDITINPDHLVGNTSSLVLGHIHEKHYVSLQPTQGQTSVVKDLTQSRKPEYPTVPSLSSAQGTRMPDEDHAGTAPKLTATKEKSNYAQLCQILVTMGSGVLRETFDRISPPQSLQNHLNDSQNHKTLRSLRKERILTSKQWGQLYPGRAASVSSEHFDPTLLMVLLRTVCELTPPTAGWDAPPHAADTSPEADIARVRYFMNTVLDHADKGRISDAVFVNYCENIRGTLVRLGGTGYGDAMDKIVNQNMDPITEEHYKELLMQWKKNEDCIKDKMNELDSATESSGDEDMSGLAHVIEGIRQIYKTREGSVLPVPWCEDFSFHLDKIFTRLRIIDKEKTRGTLSQEITNMTAIFKAHEECQKPRTVLIEGDPGMGKTTYCQKLAYDWASRREDWDESFPEIELLLLLRCYDIETNIWEAINEQILPKGVDKESKENFFKFIRENQSKVLLVLDGLDEVDPSNLAMYFTLAERREFSKCPIVLTCRHEVGVKFRRFCDTLWEIVGFTTKDATDFIFKYFKDNLPLAHKLLEQLSSWSGSRDLRQMMSNPLNTTLLCLLCEDFQGSFPTSRAQLYIEIVLCVLRRYEQKNQLSSTNDDLIKVYEKELIHLGHMAFKSLCEGELYIEESKFDCSSTVLNVLIKFGFLSVQDSLGSRRKRCVRYGFMHKSFQEFFSGFYLASKILSGEVDCDTVVTDERYLDELKQAFLFMSGIVVSRCKETAVCLVKSMAANAKEIRNLQFAFDCIKECATHEKNIQSQLLRTFGSHLDIEALDLTPHVLGNFDFDYICEILTVNTTLTHLDLSKNSIGASSAASLSDAIKVNTVLTHVDLSENKIGASGAASLSDAIKVNTVLTNLNLTWNRIGSSGAGLLSDAMKVNTVLTDLNLSNNGIGDSGAGFLSHAIKVNTVLTDLNLNENEIGDNGAGFLSDAMKVNTVLTNLNLGCNEVGESGAGFLSDAMKVNTVLTDLNLSKNGIGDSGAGFLSDGIKVNTVLTNLNLSGNKIGASGARFLSDAIKVNTVLTNLDLRFNAIGDSGAGFLSDAIKVNTALTNLNLRGNKIGPSGSGFLSDAIKVNNGLTHLDLSSNAIGDSGAGFLSDAIKVNTVLTILKLSRNTIGNSGVGFLSVGIKVNTVLTILDLSRNTIDDSGAGFLSDAIKVNTVLTHLDLSTNAIGDSGAGFLSEAIKVNTVLTHLDLSRNVIGDTGAGFLSDAIKVNTVLTNLRLSRNRIGDSGAGFLSDAIKINTVLTHLHLRLNKFGASGAGFLSDAIKIRTVLTHLTLSGNGIGS